MTKVISNRLCAARRLQMAYLITALARGKLVRERRTQTASAAVLAMKLAEEGGLEVTIQDERGQSLDIEAFRRRYLPPLGSPRAGAST